MSLDRKLSSWVEAGVIDEATRQRIAAHEHARRKPYALYAMLVLGGGTVALGLVSVIASNWDSISGGVKLTADLFLALTLAAATAWSVLRGRALATEVLVCVFYGFTLASLALVGQVYQLATPTYQGLLVWSASTLPLVLLGRSRYLAVLAVTGLWSTHGLAFEALFETLESQRTAHAEDLIAALLFASPFMYIALARLPWLRRERPEYAGTLQALSWLALLLAGFGLQFAWYESVDNSDTMRVGIAVTAGIALGFGFALPRLYSDAPREGLFTLCAIVGFGWLSFAVGFGIPHGSSDVVGALMQLAWLAAFARASLQFGLVRVFNSLTALIALRIVVVYFEVFGSLLDTGLGLITGGALTLLLAYLWRRKVRTLTAATGAGHAA